MNASTFTHPRILKRFVIAIMVALILLGISACAGLRVTGSFSTPYGSVSSDGKMVNIEARTGFAK